MGELQHHATGAPYLPNRSTSSGKKANRVRKDETVFYSLSAQNNKISLSLISSSCWSTQSSQQILKFLTVFLSNLAQRDKDYKAFERIGKMMMMMLNEQLCNNKMNIKHEDTSGTLGSCRRKIYVMKT